MNSGRTIFASGMILGAALGFSAGHLTLWGRSAQHADRLQPLHASGQFSEDEFRQNLAEPDFLPPELGAPLPALTTAYGTGVSRSSDARTLQGSNPQVDSEPTTTVLLDSSGTVESTVEPTLPTVISQQDQQLLPPANTLLPRKEPSAIQVPHAVPLTEHDAAREQEIRELIDLELKDTPSSQRDVWFDSLRDMSKEDAGNVLKMWKQFGGPSRKKVTSPGVVLPLTPIEKPPKPVETGVSGNGPAIQRAREILSQNITSQRNPGYKRRIPWLAESVRGRHLQLSSRVDFSQGILEPTESPFDWAIEGDGFFVVTSGDETYYTRGGHWSLNDSRQLVLAGSNPPLKLQVDWTIPEDAVALSVSSDGVVSITTSQTDAPHAEPEIRELGRLELARFLNPNGLNAVTGSLFQETRLSGKAHRGAAGTGGLGSIRQGVLEVSNVDADVEYLAIEDLDMFLQQQLVNE